MYLCTCVLWLSIYTSIRTQSKTSLLACYKYSLTHIRLWLIYTVHQIKFKLLQASSAMLSSARTIKCIYQYSLYSFVELLSFNWLYTVLSSNIPLQIITLRSMSSVLRKVKHFVIPIVFLWHHIVSLKRL